MDVACMGHRGPRHAPNLHCGLHLSILFLACSSGCSTYAGQLNVSRIDILGILLVLANVAMGIGPL